MACQTRQLGNWAAESGKFWGGKLAEQIRHMFLILSKHLGLQPDVGGRGDA